MTETTTITCNCCEADLGWTNYEYEYRLALVPQPKARMSGMVYSMGIKPPIDETKHFCNLICLGAWLARLRGPKKPPDNPLVG